MANMDINITVDQLLAKLGALMMERDHWQAQAQQLAAERDAAHAHIARLGEQAAAAQQRVAQLEGELVQQRRLRAEDIPAAVCEAAAITAQAGAQE